MNVRIQYSVDFLAGVYSDNMLTLNKYSVGMSLITRTADKMEMNIAMERLKCFIFSEMSDTVFIHQDQRDRAELMLMMGMNITTLPDDPVDQIIGMMLYCKLNAVMEGRMAVLSVDISSEDSGGVVYMHDEEEPVGPFKVDGWWDNASTQHNNIVLEVADDNVVKVVTDPWAEYGLLWPGDETKPTANAVVYANFGRNEDKPVQ
jgi:hypothetical protein